MVDSQKKSFGGFYFSMCVWRNAIDEYVNAAGYGWITKFGVYIFFLSLSIVC